MKHLYYKKQVQWPGRFVCNKFTLRSFHSNSDCSVMRDMIEALLVPNYSQGTCRFFGDDVIQEIVRCCVFYTPVLIHDIGGINL
jgi:hypothetical protein